MALGKIKRLVAGVGRHGESIAAAAAAAGVGFVGGTVVGSAPGVMRGNRKVSRFEREYEPKVRATRPRGGLIVSARRRKKKTSRRRRR